MLSAPATATLTAFLAAFYRNRPRLSVRYRVISYPLDEGNAMIPSAAGLLAGMAQTREPTAKFPALRQWRRFPPFAPRI
jgi:hypothetical protein